MTKEYFGNECFLNFTKLFEILFLLYFFLPSQSIFSLSHSLQPELDKICRGEIYSELHQIFTTGLSKERGAMKYQEKYGPADHLSDKKVSWEKFVTIYNVITKYIL